VPVVINVDGIGSASVHFDDFHPISGHQRFCIPDFHVEPAIVKSLHAFAQFVHPAMDIFIDQTVLVPEDGSVSVASLDNDLPDTAFPGNRLQVSGVV